MYATHTKVSFKDYIHKTMNTSNRTVNPGKRARAGSDASDFLEMFCSS